MLRQLLLVAFLLISCAVPLYAQDETPSPPVISSVNSVDITPEQFQTRYQLEGLLLIQEITAFAALLAESGSTPEQIQAILETRFPLQLQALEQPDAFAETILTSMESDLLLVTEADPVLETTVESLVIVHVAAATPVLLPPESQLVDNMLALATDAFYAEAEQFAGADESTVRALFAARALRQSAFEAVALQITAEQFPDETALARARQQAFQNEMVALRESGMVERNEEWQQFIPTEPDLQTEFMDRLANFMPPAEK